MWRINFPISTYIIILAMYLPGLLVLGMRAILVLVIHFTLRVFSLQHKYNLHAVMVHEGEAISGHYWSYVYNSHAACWLKFNDISVSQSSWHDVIREGEGGSGTASAYCLIYIKSDAEGLQSGDDNPSTTAGT